MPTTGPYTPASDDRGRGVTGDRHDVATEVAALAAALDRRDTGAARRALAACRSGGRTDDAALELLARRAADDATATELLVETIDETGLARAAVALVLVDESAIDDVSQDVLIAVARSVGSFRGEAKFTTWLHGLARNRAVDHLRRQRATTPLAPDDVGEVERMSSIIATRAAARSLVAQLPEHYREAVALRELEQWTYREIADHLGRNENTVKAHVSRGRALLATYLGDGTGSVPDGAP
ncbi:RNA polymerase sigma factor [Nitriliruptoraceae bacterium ZYF776]|nr:RNA polymerase sigma factor [Profundirhabdus halotolerans]